MPDYDFSTLNDKEFEHLVTDLLSAEMNTSVERFREGRDGGIDGRFFEASGMAIIQCKHWLKSGFSALLSHCKSQEAAKVDALAPTRYIIATSLPLSPSNKSQLIEAFAPHIRQATDVIGKDDLNQLLQRHQRIERANHKLWLSSTNVLQRILNAGVHGRSKFVLQEFSEASEKFVSTADYHRAISKLEQSGAIVIVGSPGIGKTALAGQLGVEYAANGYEFISVVSELTEAEGVYDDQAKQFFYFDDFLGSNVLTAIEDREDSHLMSFIRRVSRDPKKRFVLTSRTHIFNAGLRLSEAFRNSGLDLRHHEISIGSLSRFDRANVLYNHLWFGNLPEAYIEQLYQSSRYLSVVDSENFNPRLIEFITEFDRVSDLSPRQYWPHVQVTLSNPGDIWRGVLERQLGPVGRDITVAIALVGEPVDESCIRRVHRFAAAKHAATDEPAGLDYELQRLLGATINAKIGYQGARTFELFNPAIADFVIGNLLSNESYIAGLAYALRTSAVVKQLKRFELSGLFGGDGFYELLLAIIEHLKTEPRHRLGEKFDYAICLLVLEVFERPDFPEELFVDLATRLISSPMPKAGKTQFEFLLKLLERDLVDAAEFGNDELLRLWIDSLSIGVQEAQLMHRLAETLHFDASVATDIVREAFIAELHADIHWELEYNDVYGELLSEDDYDEREAIHFLTERTAELPFSLEHSDIAAIVETIDVGSIVESNISAIRWADDEDERLFRDDGVDGQDNSDQAIHDLFERD